MGVVSTTRRRFPGPTQAKRCQIPVRVPGSTIPWPCGDKVYKAGICRDHWLDKRHAQESRRGTEAINVQRRERNGTPLPKDLSRATVAVREVTPKEEAREPIDERRKRQGISGATQDYLVSQAARKRALRAGFDPDQLTKKQLWRFRAARR